MIELKKLKFSKTHEWIRVEGQRGTVGVTEHAQKEISDVVFVELPQTGRQVAQGQEIAVVESVKAAFSIYAPVSGRVVEVNEKLSQDPGLINRSPYEEGTIFTLEIKDPSELDALMDSGSYEQWVKGGEKDK